MAEAGRAAEEELLESLLGGEAGTKYTRRWMAGRPELLATVAAVLAHAAWDIAGILPVSQQRLGAMGLVPDCTPEEWLGFYRDGYRLLPDVLAGFLAAGGKGELGRLEEMLCVDEWPTGLLASVRDAPKRDTVGMGKVLQMLPDEQFAEIASQLPEVWTEMRASVETELAKEVENGEELTEDEMGEEDAASLPGLHFALKVALPCWVLTGKWAGRLLEEARKGENLDALRFMLALDPVAAQDPEVARILFEAVQTNPVRHRMLVNASVTGVDGKLNSRQVKLRLGAVMQTLSAFCGLWFSANDLRELFHHVAYDHGHDEGDPDFGEEQLAERSFAEALQEARDELPLSELIRGLTTCRKVRVKQQDMPAED